MPSYANASEGEVGPTGLEPGRALKNCPVGNFSEGDRLPRGLERTRVRPKSSYVKGRVSYLFLLPTLKISAITSTITATVMKMPTPMPVLKIPPIMLHELTDKPRNKAKIRLKNFEVFMARNLV